MCEGRRELSGSEGRLEAAKPPEAPSAVTAAGRVAASVRGPLQVIEASRGAVAVDLRELWSYRELLLFLVWRDVKVRYKQAALGAAWALLQPLLAMAAFTL